MAEFSSIRAKIKTMHPLLKRFIHGKHDRGRTAA